MRIKALLVAVAIPWFSATAHADVVNVYDLDVGPGFSGSVSSVPFVGGGLDFSQTTFEINFAPQTLTFSLPTLSDLGLSGRLNSIDFSLSSSLQEYSILHDFAGVELDPTEQRWQVRGFHYFSGNIDVRAGGSTVGSIAIDFDVFGGACGGTVSTTCTIAGQEFISAYVDNIALSDVGDGPIELAYSDFKLIGSLNNDRGTFHEGDYTADWGLSQFLLATYDVAPVSQVPLPPAFLLFLTALGGLGMFGWRNRRASTPA